MSLCSTIKKRVTLAPLRVDRRTCRSHHRTRQMGAQLYAGGESVIVRSEGLEEHYSGGSEGTGATTVSVGQVCVRFRLGLGGSFCKRIDTRMDP